MKYLLGAYALAYVLIVFLGRSYLVWRKTGARPVTYRQADTAHDLVGRYFLVLVFLSLIGIGVYLFLPGLYPFLVPVPWLEALLLTYFGLGLLWASFLWTVVAQSQMGESWRIGIDREAHPPLVTGGLFRFSRNPIYIGVRGSVNLLMISLVTATAMLAICLLALVETTNTAEATSLPQNGKIAFSSSTGSSGQHEIYTVEPDGSGLRTLPNGASPSWSPDGTKIAFGGDHITVMDADGSNRRDHLTDPSILGQGAGISDLTWSPDGQKLAFYSGIPPDYIHDIYTMDPDGSNLTNLTNTPAFTEMDPDFSPDGSQICYYRGSGGPTPPTGIYIMNADGSGPTLLSEDADADQLDWSPAGMEIIFHSIFESAGSDAEYGDEEIYIINADGSGRTALTSNSAVDVEPDWSPDGKKITFSSDRDGGDYDIYTMDADGFDVAQVTENSGVNDSLPDWLPLPRPTEATPEKQQEERQQNQQQQQPQHGPKSRSVTVHPPDTGGPSLLLVVGTLLFSMGVGLYTVVKIRM